MLFYAKMAKNDTFVTKNSQQLFFSKNTKPLLQNNLQGMCGPNFSSKASVMFSYCGGKCQKINYNNIVKM